MGGKMVRGEWSRKQCPQASICLEERLPEPRRIGDILVTQTDGRRCAIEFQCAPLDVEEWRLRHAAYRKASIQDTWIIGSNRREKQEAFIEAIIVAAHEVMFLDPLALAPHAWLRWAVTREMVHEWQRGKGWDPGSKGWGGQAGFGR